MYVKNLKIYKSDAVIRDINFKMGFNFIVDETSGNILQETGNNVGKTTVLKLIDFCLGGKVDEIYTDPENKNNKYSLVKDYLEDNNVFVSLTLTNDLQNSEKTILIERNFLSGKNKIIKINKEIISDKNKEFERHLKKLIFPNLENEKPTFRQIIAQNIRYNEKRVNNTLKVLNNYANDLEYETLYLFLLGCDINKMENKEKLNVKLRDELNFKKKLEKNQNKFTYQIALGQINNELISLENKKNKLNLNINFSRDLETLNKIKYEISKLSKTITQQTLRKKIIINSIQDMKKEMTNIDLNMLKNIYGQAQEYIANIHKKFEELLMFHNKMIQEKNNFIAKELPELTNSINKNNITLETLLEKESSLTETIKKGDPFKEHEKIINLMNEKYLKKGEYEGIINQISEVEKNIKSYEIELKEIEAKTITETYKKVIEQQISKFNQYFSMVSEKLYGEKYILSYQQKKQIKTQQKYYAFEISNLNLSSGKKQGEILCYDIAYILFADQEKIDCIHFLLNDKKEIMHINQLAQLVDFLKNKNIQLIIPILMDKLTKELTSENNIILKLSQKNKLFKI